MMFNNSLVAAKIFHIEDGDGNDILTFQPLHRYQSIGFSSSGLVTGKTYVVYLGGTSTVENIDGLFFGGKYSGGTNYTTFTVSSTVTSINK
jgi:hypothetical protein